MLKKVGNYTGVYVYESTSKKVDGKPDRCFYVRFKVNGKAYEEKVGWASEGWDAREAEKKKIELRENVERQGNQVNEPTLQDIWEKYEPWAKRERSPRSHQLYTSYWRNYVQDMFGHRKLTDVTPEDIEQFKHNLLERYSVNTVKGILAFTGVLFNRARTWRLSTCENPGRSVRVQGKSKKVRYLSQDEAETLLTALRARSKKCHDVTYLALYTGMRSSEILLARKGDVSLEDDLLHIPAENAKTREQRDIYLLPEVKKILTSWTVGKPEEPLFPNTEGGFNKCQPDMFYKTVYKTGLSGVTFHTLRHTFASWLAIQGVSLYIIKDLMGHKTIQSTEIYAHLSPQSKQRAMGALEAIA